MKFMYTPKNKELVRIHDEVSDEDMYEYKKNSKVNVWLIWVK